MPGGLVRFRAPGQKAVTAIVDGPPERSGGVGGWVASERAGRRPVKWWKGLPDDTYTWQLIIDRDVPATVGGVTFTPGPAEIKLPNPRATVTERVQRLRQMGQPDDSGEPPPVTISGDVFGPDEHVEWVIEGVTLGARLFGSGGVLRRQSLTVTLSRYVENDGIEVVKIGRTRDKQGRRRRRTVKTKAGDTLRAVALRELGSGSRWKDIVAWNKSKLKGVAPDVRLRVGTQLSLSEGTSERDKRAKRNQDTLAGNGLSTAHIDYEDE